MDFRGISTFLTYRVALTMSVDEGKADLALGRIGAFLVVPLTSRQHLPGGRSDRWIKVKNRQHPAFVRLMEQF